MNSGLRYLTLLFLLAVSSFFTANAVPSTLILGTLPSEYAIAHSSLLLEDTDKSIPFETLKAKPEQFHWSPIQQSAPNFSFSKSAFWIWFRLENPSYAVQKRVFQIAMPLQDYIDFYQVDAATGNIVRAVKTGDRRPFNSRLVKTNDFVFPISLEPGKTYNFFVRFDTHDGLFEALPMSLWKQKAFYEHAQEMDLVYGAYYGAILSILLFNLFLFVSTRERLYGIYSLYLGIFFVWNLTFRGWSYLYWWPDWPTLNNQSVLITGSLIFIFMIWFSTEYIETKSFMPKTHKSLKVLAALTGTGVVMGLLNYYALPFALMTPVFLLIIVLMMFAGIKLALAGHRTAKFFVIAWIILLTSAIIYFARVVGLIASTPVTEYSLQVGSVLEFLLLAFGLADRINLLKSEKLALQEAALESEKTTSSKLEVLVKERTLQLEELNKQLKQQSITDGLTGLYNRRYFNTRLDILIRQNQPFCLMILDIDHFKQYNDLYGHHKGDNALIEISRSMQSVCTPYPADVFRIGGEEFACLVKHFDQVEMHTLAHSICKSVADKNIKHEKNVVPYVSISAGTFCIAGGRNTLTADKIFTTADEALYKAKAQGRNQVVSAEI